MLLYDFMLGEAQEILAKRDLVPTNPKIMPLPEGLALTFMDPAQMLDQGREVDRALGKNHHKTAVRGARREHR